MMEQFMSGLEYGARPIHPTQVFSYKYVKEILDQIITDAEERVIAKRKFEELANRTGTNCIHCGRPYVGSGPHRIGCT